jgi:TPR repeat protein
MQAAEDLDPQASARWFTKLAESGDAEGMYQLADVLAASDPQAARNWLARAADAGLDWAQNDLAVLDFGCGVQPDPSRPQAADPAGQGCSPLIAQPPAGKGSSGRAPSAVSRPCRITMSSSSAAGSGAAARPRRARPETT